MALKIRKNMSPKPPRDCPLTECMSVIGGAWTPNVLTMRLRGLEEKGVVNRKVRPTSPPSVEYSLTALGEELVPAIEAIVAVGHKIKQR